MSNYEYVGCFLDYAELSEKVKDLRQNPLQNEKYKPHVTFEYKPISVNKELLGQKIFVTIIGYGNNGENEGLQVSLSCDNELLNSMIQNIDRPHITLAVSSSGKPVNTKFLDFYPIEPIHIVGVYGGHIDE